MVSVDGRIRVRGGRAFYFFGALGAVLYGYDTGVIGGALLFIKAELHLSSFQQGLITSIILVGAMVGALVSGPLADRFGRRPVLLVSAVIFLIGTVAATVAPDVPTLIVARAVLGLAVGNASVLVPLYLAEMAPTRIRGAIASLNQALIIVGLGIATLVDYLVRNSQDWRLAFGIGLAPALVMLVGVLFMPETPRWLVRNRRPEDAAIVLAVTREPAEVTEELGEIERIDRTGAGKARLATIFGTPWIRRLLVLGVLLAIGQQISGINTIVYYTPTILTSIGVSTSFSLLFGVVITTPTNIIAVAIATAIVDRVGRKPLLFYGGIALAVGMACVGLPELFGATGDAAALLTFIGLVIFTITFSLTWGPVLWVVLSEIFPLAARGTAMGIATIANWVLNFLVSLTLPLLLAAWGTGPVFTMYAVFGVLVVIFVGTAVPETKGRSLEQLETQARGSTV